MSIYLYFSETAARQDSSGGLGYKQALTDEGELVPFTVKYESQECAEANYHWPDKELMAIVSESRMVIDNKGQPVNRTYWEEWGYKPKGGQTAAGNALKF